MRTRPANPILSPSAQSALEAYQRHLRDEVDLQPATVRNYLSDLQHFMAWCEAVWSENQETIQPFALEQVATPTLTRYRDHLQRALQLQPDKI